MQAIHQGGQEGFKVVALGEGVAHGEAKLQDRLSASDRHRGIFEPAASLVMADPPRIGVDRSDERAGIRCHATFDCG